MEVTRRQALTAVAGAAVGAAGAVGAVRLVEHLDESTPLPFYGSPVSAVRPDRSPPSARAASVVWGGTGEERRVALTFDDGPHPKWTPRVLAALEAEGVPATFFCLGRNVRDHGALHHDSVGHHELANHTFDHPDLGRHDWAGCRDQITRTSRIMEQTYGATPTLFRPPYGHVGGAAVLAAAELGLTTVLWSAQAREDLVAAHPDGIVDDIASQVRPGSIVLAHDTGGDDRLVTIDRLRAVIARLREEGYAFVTVSALLAGSSATATAASHA
ncbi:polysaccharide deacetylase family protein [Terrabacter sp. NPDC080008]|uniref:polysaccharide deacetylase family protein n=1 Tax=Terrabacter sp. NPDC080008 TaxID=3155176 RepID=UPI00344FCB43